MHADATLAASAAHMAGPLLTSKHLQVLPPPALLQAAISRALMPSCPVSILAIYVETTHATISLCFHAEELTPKLARQWLSSSAFPKRLHEPPQGSFY